MNEQKLFAIVRHCNFNSETYKDTLIETFSCYQVNQAENIMSDRFFEFIQEIENDEMLKYLNRDWFFDKKWERLVDKNDGVSYIKFGKFWHWKLYEVSTLDGWKGSDCGKVIVDKKNVYFEPDYIFPVCPKEAFDSLDTQNKTLNVVLKRSGDVAVIVDGTLWALESTAEKALSKVGSEIDTLTYKSQKTARILEF